MGRSMERRSASTRRSNGRDAGGLELPPFPAEPARPGEEQQRQHDDDTAVISNGTTRVAMQGARQRACHATAGARHAKYAADEAERWSSLDPCRRNQPEDEGKQDVASYLPQCDACIPVHALRTSRRPWPSLYVPMATRMTSIIVQIPHPPMVINLRIPSIILPV